MSFVSVGGLVFASFPFGFEGGMWDLIVLIPKAISERKKKQRQTEEEMGRQYQRVDRNGLCQLN